MTIYDRRPTILPWIGVGLLFTIGYLTGSYVHRNDGFVIQDGVITYNQHMQTSRSIRCVDGKIRVGTLAERLDDVLHERPSDVRQSIREILARDGIPLPSVFEERLTQDATIKDQDARR